MRPRFRDEVVVSIRAGKGGPGGVSFHREKFKRIGPPDGGDGGNGGSVIFRADPNFVNLNHFNPSHKYSAESGDPGDQGHRSGAQGKDIILKVPVGTSLFDEDKNELIGVLSRPGEVTIAAKGGIGGKGNAFFKSPTRRSPYFSQKGREGQAFIVRLELKLIADVGIVGLPNAGKSTLISRCSQARPKIADYPFTTIEPVLGIVELSGFRRYVLADIPGLIEGAHDGAGLGHDFLKHIERTKILAHIVDIMPIDGSDPVQNYKTIRSELEKYSIALSQKPEIIIANKIDLDPDGVAQKNFEEKLNLPVHPISAVTGSGIKSLIELLWQKVKEQK
jgi:GTP-binding protein